jgi:hypothetical protein
LGIEDDCSSLDIMPQRWDLNSDDCDMAITRKIELANMYGC